MIDTIVEKTNVLKLIGDNSPLLEVKDLPHRGRGYVATQDIEAGTLIHVSNPLAMVVNQEWMPETCMGCFDFSYPKKMKTKAVSTTEETQALLQWWVKNSNSNSNNKNIKLNGPLSPLRHVAFCTDQCKQTHVSAYSNEEWYTWLTCMYRLENYRPTSNTETPCDDLDDPTDILHDDKALRIYLDKLWEDGLKGSQGDFDDNDRTMCRFIASCLVKRGADGFDALWTMQDNELGHFRHTRQIQPTMQLYHHFVSAMTQPMTHHNITIPPGLLPEQLTSDLFRAIYYREMANSFGLWEPSEQPVVTDDLELLGFGIYPSAVYFNHSCQANAVKLRHKSTMQFYTRQHIHQGDEVCISYGNVEAPFAERQQRLLDHYYFTCACTRCRLEQ